jgi:hypothetical protein
LGIFFTSLLSWESFKHVALLALGNNCSAFVENFTKLFEIDLAFIISISVIFYRFYEFNPFDSKLLENFRINLNCLILMHFLVNNAKVLIVFGWLPALLVVANIYFLGLRFVLSEVQPFCWEHFRSDRNLEILVGNNAVAVDIEFVENFLEFVLCDF